jgi:hypothetical protein
VSSHALLCTSPWPDVVVMGVFCVGSLHGHRSRYNRLMTSLSAIRTAYRINHPSALPLITSVMFVGSRCRLLANTAINGGTELYSLKVVSKFNSQSHRTAQNRMHKMRHVNIYIDHQVE